MLEPNNFYTPDGGCQGFFICGRIPGKRETGTPGHHAGEDPPLHLLRLQPTET